MGFGYWSVAAYLKFQAKGAVRYVTQYEEAMVRLARQAGVEGVICGHIHRAEIRTVQGFEYLNCGDWVESCTALAEDFEGNIHLLRLDGAKKNALSNPAVHGVTSAGHARMRSSERSASRTVPVDRTREAGSLSEDLTGFEETGTEVHQPVAETAELGDLRCHP
jgi:hypothetical protein